MSNSYKLVVPRKVEEMIRYLIRKYPSTEWSGVLFYSFEGTFEENNLVITCRDFLPMDLGTGTHTQFNRNSEIANYIANHISLATCYQGLVH